MSEMIDRVARALRLESASRRLPGITEDEMPPLDDLAPGIGKMYRRQARAAIAAMCEPTEAITEAMHFAWDRRDCAPGPFTLEKLWRAGIAAALAEPTSPP